ncbi:MAG: glucosyltransferase-I, partial [Gemmatimonadota bacterium]
GTILHYDGSEWSGMTSGTQSVLTGVWGTSSTDIYAVGGDGVILHYDGTAWSDVWSGPGVSGVWGTSPTDV